MGNATWAALKATSKAALARFNAAEFGTAEYEAASVEFFDALKAVRMARKAEQAGVSRA